MRRLNAATIRPRRWSFVDACVAQEDVTHWDRNKGARHYLLKLHLAAVKKTPVPFFSLRPLLSSVPFRRGSRQATVRIVRGSELSLR